MNISELTLPEIDIRTEAFAADPFTPYKEAIKQHWLAQTPTGYMVLGFEDMRDLLIKDDILETANKVIAQLMGADPEKSAWARWNNNILLSKSGDEHNQLRMHVAKTFTPKNAQSQRPVMEEVIGSLLDEWVPKGEFNFTEFASYFPITVMCRLIGADPALVPKMKGAIEDLAVAFDMDPSLVPKLDEAVQFLWNVVDDLFTEREANPPARDEDKDLLDQLLDATKTEGGLSKEDLYDLIIVLFAAGYDTSKNGLGFAIHLLLDRPDYWQRLVDNEKGFAKKIIEEFLRMTNVVPTYRIVKEDLVWKDVTIPAGTMLIFPLPLAGQDESVFDNASTFNPDRDQSRVERHFGWGRGIHICLGQHIAREQLEVALPMIAARMPDLSRNGDIEWRSFPTVWGLKNLPIKTRKAG